MEQTILQEFSRNWSIILLRGILTVIFGIIAIVLPGITLLALILLLSVYLLINGISNIWISIKSREWWLLIAGLISVIAAILIYFYPIQTEIILLYFVAIWAIVDGLLELIFSLGYHKKVKNVWIYIFSSVISILFGIVLIVFPISSLFALIWLIGIYAIIFGILVIIFAINIYKIFK